MPVQLLGVLSLTKFIPIPEVLSALAQLEPGVTTAADVRAAPVLDDVWNDLVEFDPRPKNDRAAAGAEIVVDDTLLTAARNGAPEGLLLLWCAILLADHRLEELVRTWLTDADGRFIEQRIARDVLFAELQTRSAFGGDPTKATTNLLRNLVNAELFVPTTYGGSITGVDRFLPTGFAVPSLLRLIEDRVQYWADDARFVPTGSGAMLEFALSLGANHWLGLSRDEFVRAARGASAPVPPTPRLPVPKDLLELQALMESKRQVVLQGPPGTGKTHLAKAYIDWASSGRRDDSRLQNLLDSLPMRERTPERIADEVEGLGLTALWEIVQFHPSYEYNDFVRTLAAEPVPGGVTFVARHRILSLIAAVGVELERRGSDCELVLVLDEVNRGNIPSIFGELLYALEYRGQPVATAYSVDGDASITIPERLSVIGTMNTADRSIAVIDYALRRRFVFLTVPASGKPIDQHPDYATDKHRDAAGSLFVAVHAALEASASGIQVGPSYYLPSRKGLPEPEAVRELASRFVYEVLPLLEEYVLEGELDEASLTSLLDSFQIDRDAATSDQVDALRDALLA